MGKYQDATCPICHKPIENGERIAICPICGAPYHKECVEKTGKCIYDDLHAAGKSWQPPKKKEETYTRADVPNRCSRCGSLNPTQGLFCEVCGNPLRSVKQSPNEPVRDGQSSYHGNAGVNIGEETPGGRGYQTPPPQQMAYNPFTTPFGGVNPDEKIDDVPVKDIAIFVGQNSSYFIPKFKQFSDNKSWFSFNFAAMFFHGFYFLYRKMYLWGALLLFVMLALSVPSILITIDTARQMINPGIEAWFNSQQLLMLGNIFSMIMVFIRFAAGIFANRLYKSHTMNMIQKIQDKNLDHDTYVSQLTKQGSVSTKLIMIFVGIYFISMFLFSFLLITIGF